MKIASLRLTNIKLFAYVHVTLDKSIPNYSNDSAGMNYLSSIIDASILRLIKIGLAYIFEHY